MVKGRDEVFQLFSGQYSSCSPDVMEKFLPVEMEKFFPVEMEYKGNGSGLCCSCKASKTRENPLFSIAAFCELQTGIPWDPEKHLTYQSHLNLLNQLIDHPSAIYFCQCWRACLQNVIQVLLSEQGFEHALLRVKMIQSFHTRGMILKSPKAKETGALSVCRNRSSFLPDNLQIAHIAVR